MADSDGEDYVTVGTPIERELEARGGWVRKAAGDGGGVKALPVWQQAATDEQGRRRFHGAFTGGFSAGYYNSVGSKEGWQPAAFVSSRSARAPAADVRRDARHYMDADELQEAEAAQRAVGTRAEYDTLGGDAQAAAEQHRAVLDGARPSALPGPVLSELVVAVSESIGARLLRKMGWRTGKGVARKASSLPAPAPRAAPAAAPRVEAALAALREGEETVMAGDEAEAHDDAQCPPPEQAGEGEGEEGEGAAVDAAAAAAERVRRRRRRWGGVAGALAEEVEVPLPPQKLDTHGLGFDPFAGAEEFRAAKRRREEGPPGGGKGGLQPGPGGPRSRGAAFGVGVFEAMDDDVYGAEGGEGRRGLLAALPHSDDDSGEEDEAQRFGATARALLTAGPQRLALGAPRRPGGGGGAAAELAGFVRAGAGEQAPPEHFPPPPLPRGWQPLHRFPAPLASLRGGPAPLSAVPAPCDAELARRCDTLAAFVALNGPSFETLARQRQAGDPRFCFLFGGEGAAYYAWRRAHLCAAPAPPPRPEQRSQPLSAEERGRLLGEERLASSGAGGAGGPGVPAPPPPPAPKGIAESDRAALLASLGRTFTRESSGGGGAAAAPPGLSYGLQQQLGSKFASGGVELAGAAPAPGLSLPAASEQAGGGAAPLPRVRRSVDEWGPEPLLCKRFAVPDPFKGRTRPAERRTFRTDALALPGTAEAEAAAAPKFLAQPAEPPPPPPPPPQQQPQQQKQLPPPPPLPASMLPPPPPRPAAPAARDEVDDFFASLAPLPAASDGITAAAAPSLPAATEKPIDLFKAIFEADDEEDDEEDDDEPPTAVPVAALAPAAPPPPAAAPGASQWAAPLSALATLARERKEAKRAKKREGKDKKHKKKHHKSSKRSRRSESGSSESG